MSTEYVTSKITDNLYLVRVIDKSTKYFEGLWHIPEGVVYNSYVLVADEGSVVFDTVKPEFKGEYLEALTNIVDLRDVKYIVAHHMEPDHSGLLKELAEKTGARIVGHPLVGRMLRSFYGFAGSFQPAEDGRELILGSFKLRFIHTPWLHWPETMMSYIENYSALLTCDAFGAYGAYKKVFYDELSEEESSLYRRHMLKYFANIIGYYRQWVLKNLDKLGKAGIQPKYLLPSHGLLVRESDVDSLIKLYEAWGKGDTIKSKITLVYTSMYGFVEKVSGIARNRLEAEGYLVRVYGFNDKQHAVASEVLADVYDSEVVIIATSSYDADSNPVAKHIVDLIAKKTPLDRKLIIVAALYGWGPRAGSVLKELLSRAGAKEIRVFERETGDYEKLAEDIINSIINSN